MSYWNHDPKEARARAEAIYRNKVLEQINETAELGKTVVIDIDTGDYEIDADDVVATQRLIKRRPNVFTYAFRVGYRAMGRIGKVPLQ